MATEVNNKCAPRIGLDSIAELSPKLIKQEEESVSAASGDSSSALSVASSNVDDEIDGIRKKRKISKISENFDFELKNESTLNEHDDGDELSRLECPVCFKPMEDELYLQVHLACHADERPFSCQFCYKSFQSKSNLLRHQKVHQQGGVDSDDALSVDAFSMAGDMGVKCPICSKFVRDRYYMVVHLRTHTGEKPFCCQYCDKAFNSRSNLLRHEKLHIKSGGVCCSFCSNWFENSEELNVHLAAKHKPNGGKSLTKVYSTNCLKCKKLFFLSQQQSHQQPQDQRYCPSCARQSPASASSSSASTKTSGNDGSAPPCHSSAANSNVVLFQPTYFCGICLESLESRKLLLSHVKDVHKAFKPYICDRCSAKFDDYLHYKEHERRHLVENDSTSGKSSPGASPARVGLICNGK